MISIVTRRDLPSGVDSLRDHAPEVEREIHQQLV
jgi:hypothetical protein